MIFVLRPSGPVDVIAALNRPFPQDGRSELERARAYYAQEPGPKKVYDFKRYKEWAVCRALDDLFREKCAYCESSYRAVDARDVEHFRPKGGVREAKRHPGYWWLAAEWSNLLSSCPACNQLRRHTTFELGMTLEEFERARQKAPANSSGKANSFPVLSGNWVMEENADTAIEDPLLINPCERCPDEHLEWVFDWDRTRYLWEAEIVTAVVRPRLRLGADDDYAKASIAVYGLNRAGLIRERMARVKEMQLASQPIVDLVLDLAEETGGTEPEKMRERMVRYKANLLAFTKPERPYAGMARAFVVQFEVELTRHAAAMPDTAAQELPRSGRP